ncbi:hypothetical protein ACQZV8_06230 [Magnetococcales bacterium HHB-1]
MSSVAQKVEADHSEQAQNDESSLNIIIGEYGYDICEQESLIPVIEGISNWDVACEVHEMLSGEREEAEA